MEIRDISKLKSFNENFFYWLSIDIDSNQFFIGVIR